MTGLVGCWPSSYAACGRRSGARGGCLGGGECPVRPPLKKQTKTQKRRRPSIPPRAPGASLGCSSSFGPRGGRPMRQVRSVSLDLSKNGSPAAPAARSAPPCGPCRSRTANLTRPVAVTAQTQNPRNAHPSANRPRARDQVCFCTPKKLRFFDPPKTPSKKHPLKKPISV